MAHFLKGKFKGFYQAGNSQCVRDVFRFSKSGEGKVYMEVTRRDMESVMGRYWRYENASFTLLPIDENEPRLGGKVQVRSFVFDFRAMTIGFKTQYGVYSDDFITYGTFVKAVGNPLDNEEILLKIVEEHSLEGSEVIIDKNTFRFVNNELTYSKSVNPEKSDILLNHEIGETPLANTQQDSWTETLFYGIGNKSA